MQINEQFDREFRAFVTEKLRLQGRPKGAALYKKQIQVVKNKAKGLWFLYGKQVDDYCRDMNIAQIYAQLNRRMIIAALQPFFDDFAERHQLARLEDQQLPEVIESVHNYIDFSDNIVRKGSIAAYEGKPVIIPLNMRDGVVIGFGKSNPEWNYSAPHGAGRKHSRT